MSELSDFFSEAHGEALGVIGTESAVLQGVPAAPLAANVEFEAIFNDLGRTEEVTLNGRKVTFSMIAQAAIGEFAAAPKQGQIVVRANGATYRITGEVETDELAYTLPLDTVNR